MTVMMVMTVMEVMKVINLRLCALCDLCVSDPALDIPSPRVPRGDSSLYPLSDDGDDSDEGDEGDKHLSRYFFTP